MGHATNCCAGGPCATRRAGIFRASNRGQQCVAADVVDERSGLDCFGLGPHRAVPACSGCHTPTGAGIPAQYPRLAGQHADYTQAQLLAFRKGERANNAAMSAIAAKMSDREIEAVSDYIAGLR